MDDEDQASAWRAATLREVQRLDRVHAAERADLDDRQKRERTALIARTVLGGSTDGDLLRRGAEAMTQQQPDLGLRDLIPAAEAARIAHRSKSRMGAWCRQHAIDGAAGFSVQIKGRWFVSRSRLLRHLASGSRD